MSANKQDGGQHDGPWPFNNMIVMTTELGAAARFQNQYLAASWPRKTQAMSDNSSFVLPSRGCFLTFNSNQNTQQLHTKWSTLQP